MSVPTTKRPGQVRPFPTPPAPPSSGIVLTDTPILHHDPIPGILTFGSFNLLAGASGVGKTCLLSWMLRKLRDGQDIFNRKVNTPTAIGYIGIDRGVSTARYWFARAGYPEIVMYSLVDDRSFDPRRLRHRLTLTSILGEFLDKLGLPPGSLVVLDPAALLLGGNLMDYQACAIALIEIQRLCLDRQLTMIGTAHASKQKNDTKDQYKRLQDRILGSSAQLGYANTQMYLASPEETGEKFYTFMWHPHTSVAEAFPLGRDQHGMFVPYAESTQNAEEGKILAAISAAEEGTSFAEILLTSEVPKTTVHRYLQELLKDGRVLKVGHGKYRKAPLN